jgi:outer membrane biosynthesis protein TonB
MALSRSEAVGLAIAAIGHLGLFVFLSPAMSPNPEKLVVTPIEVSISDEVGLESQAPVPSHEEAAARLSPVETPSEAEPEPAPPEPQPEPQPIAKPQPSPPRPAPAPDARPAPKPPAKPAPAAAPAKKPPAKPAAAAAPAKQPTRRNVQASGALDGILAGINNKPSSGKATTPPAATAGPAVRSALQAEVQRQVRPHWTPPSGADSEKLRTTVVVRLNRDGSIAAQVRVTQTGITDSNRAQAALHKERAIRAVTLAAPFKLPPQYYDAWKTIGPVLYEDL